MLAKLTNENAFVGAKILIKAKNHYIVKVNKTTFYACDFPYEDFERKMEIAKAHDRTFKDVCKQEGIKQYKYGSGLILENQIRPIIKNTKRLFDRKGLTEIRNHYDKMLARNSKMCTVHYDDKQIAILASKDKKALISYDGGLYFYDVETGGHIFLEDLHTGNIKSDNIPWEKAA